MIVLLQVTVENVREVFLGHSADCRECRTGVTAET